jgi:hypothetical protein
VELGGLHPITGRQWQLNDERSNALWPDACLVVPFGMQVADATTKVVNPVPGTTVQGGWTVQGTLETLELTDLVKNVKVAGVTAVWAAGPGGDTPALHVLGDNPFAWLTPHLDAAATATTTTYPLRDQWFGSGPAQLFASPIRFGELVIDPQVGSFGRLLTAPLTWLTTRMVQSPGATLSFSYPSGLPFDVDVLWLGVLTGNREEVHGPGWDVDEVITLPAGWMFALLRIDVGGGIDAVKIPYGGSILWVRYQRSPRKTTTPERITLQPGHYELLLSGKTTGKAPPGFADAADVPWDSTQRFWVDHPPSLRPYVSASTIGDDRLFGPKPGFDPTLPGVGFPIHRDYLPVVRFCVPYLKAMFPKLRLRIDYPDSADVVEDVAVVPNTAGTTTLPPAAVDWKTAHGGSIAPDDEVTMGSMLTPGAGALRIAHVPAAGEEFQLDSWSVQVSRFPNAATHLAWAGTCLTRYYRPDGPHNAPPCPTLTEPGWSHFPWSLLVGARRADDLHEFELEALSEPLKALRIEEPLAGKLLQPFHWPFDEMPDEYDAPPDDWPLPLALASLAGPLDTNAAQRFLLFLRRTGVHLNTDPAAPSLADVGNPVAATSVEAVCDDQDRPLALWLRTPEPLDWRRIVIDLTLRHVEPDSGCPSSYANRRSMALTLDVLPSTDGSGALLIARLAGTATRIPRGEVTLALHYEPTTAGLVSLRPRGPLPGGHETVTLTFLQPLGHTWPVKPSSSGGGVVHVPHVPEVGLHVPDIGPPEPGPLHEVIQLLSRGEGVE